MWINKGQCASFQHDNIYDGNGNGRAKREERYEDTFTQFQVVVHIFDRFIHFFDPFVYASLLSPSFSCPSLWKHCRKLIYKNWG